MTALASSSFPVAAVSVRAELSLPPSAAVHRSSRGGPVQAFRVRHTHLDALTRGPPSRNTLLQSTKTRLVSTGKTAKSSAAMPALVARQIFDDEYVIPVVALQFLALVMSL